MLERWCNCFRLQRNSDGQCLFIAAQLYLVSLCLPATIGCLGYLHVRYMFYLLLRFFVNYTATLYVTRMIVMNHTPNVHVNVMRLTCVNTRHKVHRSIELAVCIVLTPPTSLADYWSVLMEGTHSPQKLNHPYN